MTSIGTLLAFMIVCAGIMIMRRTQPDIPRPFKTPLVLITWLIIGPVVYFAYSRYHSKLRGRASSN